MFKKGDIVKYKYPIDVDETSARFTIVTDPNILNMVQIQLICNLNFKPISTVHILEIILAED